MCEECKRQGVIKVAELVHHKVEIAGGGAPLDPGNLESLCWSCHGKLHGVIWDWRPNQRAGGALPWSEGLKKGAFWAGLSCFL